MTRNGQRLHGESSSLLSAVVSSSNVDRRSKTNYTPRWHRQGAGVVNLRTVARSRGDRPDIHAHRDILFPLLSQSARDDRSRTARNISECITIEIKL